MTFTGNFIDLPDAGTLRLGNSNDLRISHGSGGASNIVHSNTSQPLNISATGAGNIAFLTNSNERMRIHSSGNVGIGITSPAGILHVKGSDIVQYVDSSNTAAEICFRNNTSTGDNIRIGGSGNNLTFDTGGSERMRITTDGPHLLLGGTSDVNEITESSANAGMVIGGTGFGNAGLAIITSSSGTGRLYFGDALGANAGRNRGQINYGHSDDHMRFVTAGTERMRIDSSGVVQMAVGSSVLFSRNTGGTNTTAVLFKTAGSQVGKIFFNNSDTFYSTGSSDRTVKKNFENWTESVLPLFKNLTPQKFHFIQEEDSETKHKGFIAQDEVASFPEAYPKDPDTDKYLYSPNNMVVYLMKAIQELEAKVAALEAA